MATRKILFTGRETADNITSIKLVGISISGSALLLLSDDGTPAANGNSATQCVYIGSEDVTAANGWPMRANDTLILEPKDRNDQIDPSEVYILGSAAGQVIAWMLLA